MSRQRRIRDETGGSVYYNIDGSDVVTGAGVFDTMKNVAAAAVSKLTGKAAKNIATKAAEKLVEKGAERVGEKTGQLIGEKIYDKFTTREGVTENKGNQIIKELQKGKKPTSTSQPSPMKVKPAVTISQQFDELLNI